MATYEEFVESIGFTHEVEIDTLVCKRKSQYPNFGRFMLYLHNELNDVYNIFSKARELGYKGNVFVVVCVVIDGFEMNLHFSVNHDTVNVWNLKSTMIVQNDSDFTIAVVKDFSLGACQRNAQISDKDYIMSERIIPALVKFYNANSINSVEMF